MNKHKFSKDQSQSLVGNLRPVSAESSNGIDFTPSSDEVARRAYFSYVNDGSLPGRDVQHWLKAEADLLAERNLTRVHGFHNKT